MWRISHSEKKNPLFYRHISENLAGYLNKGEIKAGAEDFDYAKMSDEDAEGARDGLINYCDWRYR